MQLVEEAVDGCWIGHRARTATIDDSGIGSVYSPPKVDPGSPVATRRKHVETVVDIGYRSEVYTTFLRILMRDIPSINQNIRDGHSNAKRVGSGAS